MRAILGATQSLGSPNLRLFKPYTSGKDFFNRITSVGTAPVGYTLASAHSLYCAVEFLAYSALYLIAIEPETAANYFINAFQAVHECIKNLLRAIISPVINTVDFVVSAGTTLAA